MVPKMDMCTPNTLKKRIAETWKVEKHGVANAASFQAISTGRAFEGKGGGVRSAIFVDCIGDKR